MVRPSPPPSCVGWTSPTCHHRRLLRRSARCWATSRSPPRDHAAAPALRPAHDPGTPYPTSSLLAPDLGAPHPTGCWAMGPGLSSGPCWARHRRSAPQGLLPQPFGGLTRHHLHQPGRSPQGYPPRARPIAWTPRFWPRHRHRHHRNHHCRPQPQQHQPPTLPRLASRAPTAARTWPPSLPMSRACEGRLQRWRPPWLALSLPPHRPLHRRHHLHNRQPLHSPHLRGLPPQRGHLRVAPHRIHPHGGRPRTISSSWLGVGSCSPPTTSTRITSPWTSWGP